MEEINWEPISEPIKKQELTEEEKKIAEECSDIEMEYKEIINTIENYYQNENI